MPVPGAVLRQRRAERDKGMDKRAARTGAGTNMRARMFTILHNFHWRNLRSQSLRPAPANLTDELAGRAIRTTGLRWAISTAL